MPLETLKDIDASASPTADGSAGKTHAVGLPGGMLVLVVVGAFFLFRQEPFHPSRPQFEDTASPEILSGEVVRARLWQDPFAAVVQHRERAFHERLFTEATPLKPGIAEAQIFSELGSGDRLTVLGIMVFGGPYDEQAERRLRSRHAALAALGALGYEPAESERIGYFVASQPSSLVVPFEWFRASHGRPGPLVLLWLNEEGFRRSPLATIAAVFGEVADQAPEAEIRFRLVGPNGSTILRAMAEELARGVPPTTLHRRVLEHLRVFSHQATIDDELLPQPKGSLDEIFRAWTQSSSSRFLRTIGTDRDLSDALIEELGLRGVKPVCKESIATCNLQTELSHVALISEWDTHYGRALPCAFIASALNGRFPETCARKSGKKKAGAEPEWIHRFSYMRGLDGQLPAEASAGKEPEESVTRTRWRAAEPVERPFGQRRLDYLQRLAEQLERLDAELRHGGEGLKAIGVLGSDVYDKLLVLQALRERFPNLVFFTTDLDASLLHPAEYRATRNLVVASSFGLELDRRLQQKVPPFRDNYQTSLFFSTRLALDPDASGSQTQKHIKAWMKPRIFEIGRGGAFDLSSGPAANNPRTDHREPWRWELGDSIHPPRVDLAGRELPSRTRKLILSAAVLALLFLAFYYGAYRGLRYAGGPSRIHLFCGLLLLIGLIASWLLVQSSDEPLALLSGISLWPSLGLRYLVGVLSLYFLAVSWKEIQRSEAGLYRELVPQLARPARPGRGCIATWRSLARLAGGRFRRQLYLLSSTGFWSFHLPWLGERRHPRTELPDATTDPAPVTAVKVMREYRRRGRLARRLIRVVPLTALYFAFSRTVILISGEPSVPFRGDASHLASIVVTIAFAVLPLIFLIFWAVDATQLSAWLTRKLADHRTRWPQATTRRVAETLNLRGELAEVWLDVQAIAHQSVAVGRLVYYPVIALLLMIASRAPYFDDWDFPIGLSLVISLSLAYSLYCSVRLRRSAEHARSTAIERFRNARIYVAGTGDRRHADQIRLLLAEVRDLRMGAFVPFAQQPCVRAVVLLFGGGGGLVLLEYLIWIH